MHPCKKSSWTADCNWQGAASFYCVYPDVSRHWGPQLWVWQCSGSSSPAPHGSEVGQLDQQPGSWLETRAVPGLQHRDVTILHRTLRAFGVCFASTDRNRTFLEQTKTPKSCLFRAPGSTRKIKPRPSPWFTSPWRTGSGQSC